MRRITTVVDRQPASKQLGSLQALGMEMLSGDQQFHDGDETLEGMLLTAEQRVLLEERDDSVVQVS